MMINRIICKIKGHSPVRETLVKLSSDCGKFQCKRCKSWYVYNRRLQVILPWDSEFKRFYEEFNKDV